MKIYAQSHTMNADPAIVATGSYFYDPGKQEWPNVERAKLFNSKLRTLQGPFILDIEHTTDIDHIKACFAMYRNNYPWLRMGLYGAMPVRKYPQASTHITEELNRKHRTGRASLASSADFVIPSLYDSYLDNESMKAFTRDMLNQAGLFHKPIIPAISHQRAGVYEYVGDSMWEAKLRLIRNHPSQPEGVFCWSMPTIEMPESAQAILREVMA